MFGRSKLWVNLITPHHKTKHQHSSVICRLFLFFSLYPYAYIIIWMLYSLAKIISGIPGNGPIFWKKFWKWAEMLIETGGNNRIMGHQLLCLYFFLLFFWGRLRYPISCSLLGGATPSQNSGYKVTRLCPSIMLSCYFVPPSSLPDRRSF